MQVLLPFLEIFNWWIQRDQFKAGTEFTIVFLIILQDSQAFLQLHHYLSHGWPLSWRWRHTGNPRKKKKEKRTNTYSGSRYPGVPTAADAWAPSPDWNAFDKPKSANLARRFLCSNMFVDFRSLWIIGGLQPKWRYSNPVQDDSLSPVVKWTIQEWDLSWENVCFPTLCCIQSNSQSLFPVQDMIAFF